MRVRIGFDTILIAAGILVGVYALSTSDILTGNVFGSNTKKVDIQKETAAAGLQNITIDTSSTNINVVKGSSDQVTARLHGNASSKKAEDIKLLFDQQADTLNIGVDVPDRYTIGLDITNVDLTVEIPEKQWNTLKMETSSGDVKASNVRAQSFMASTSSGNIAVNDVESSAINVEASSGEIKASGFKSSEAVFNAGSGNIALSGGNAAIKGETSSGDIQVDSSQLLYNTELKSGSGEVKVYLANEPASLSVDYRGGSGQGAIHWNGFKYTERDEDNRILQGSFGNGGVLLKVRTDSGNFTLGPV